MPGTLLWGLVVAVAFQLAQVIAAVVYAASGKGDMSEDRFAQILEAAQGTVLSLATFFSTAVCVPLVLGIAKMKRGARLRDYFALNPVSARTLGAWLAAVLLFIAFIDVLAILLRRPVVPPFMESAYASAQPTWILWLAIVVAAPLFEEIFFRGFLFQGFQAAMKPIGATVLTSGLWAAIHLQYDFHDIGTIFVLGLLLGTARARTNSLLPPLAMHAFANLVACAETALAVRGLAS